MKRILINATQREELRVGIVDGQKLYDLDIELASREQRKSNVYKGKITRVEPSLEACFVDYGAERHGFLPLKEVHREYYRPNAGNKGGGNARDLIAEGTEVIVQVEKEERGNKGAALTTYVSLAGRYLVLMPNNPKAGGISRRVEGEEREEAREVLSALVIPEGMGIIVRTNGIGRSAPELQADLDQLAETWHRIYGAAAELSAPFPLYKENNVVLRALRDYLRPDIGEVIVDNAEIFEEARAQMQRSMPTELNKLKLYRDDIPLFSRYQVESQIESAHERLVRLPSGGSIVIDHTEALTAIDINSAKATSAGGIEETALQTNLEAADEIARQLRLRDLGGLIVIDFIDMNSAKNQREVEKAIQEACNIDRARVQVGRLSRFGLLEMSRQRLRPSLSEHTQIACPRCEGRGQIRSVESLALAVLRLIEEECMKDRTGRVVAQLPVDVATYLLNEKRGVIAEFETRYMVIVTLVPNETLETPKYEIERIRADQLPQDSNASMSYRMPQDYKADARAALAATQGPARASVDAAVKPLLPNAPAPLPMDAEMPPKPATAAAPAMSAVPSLWQKLLSFFGFGPSAESRKADAARPPRPGAQPTRPNRDGRGDGRSAEGRRDGRPQDGQRRDNRDGGRGSDGRNENRNGQRPQDGQRRDGRKEGPNEQRNGNPNANANNPNRNRNEARNGEPRGNEGRWERPQQPPRPPQQQPRPPQNQNGNPNAQRPQSPAPAVSVPASSDAAAATPLTAVTAAAVVAATEAVDNMQSLMALPEAMPPVQGPVSENGEPLPQREGGGRRGRRGRRGRGRGRSGGENGEPRQNADGSEARDDEFDGDNADMTSDAMAADGAMAPMFDPAAIQSRPVSTEPGYAPRRDQRPMRTEAPVVENDADDGAEAEQLPKMAAPAVEPAVESESMPMAPVAMAEVVAAVAEPVMDVVIVSEAAPEIGTETAAVPEMTAEAASVMPANGDVAPTPMPAAEPAEMMVEAAPAPMAEPVAPMMAEAVAPMVVVGAEPEIVAEAVVSAPTPAVVEPLATGNAELAAEIPAVEAVVTPVAVAVSEGVAERAAAPAAAMAPEAALADETTTPASIVPIAESVPAHVAESVPVATAAAAEVAEAEPMTAAEAQTPETVPSAVEAAPAAAAPKSEVDAPADDHGKKADAVT